MCFVKNVLQKKYLEKTARGSQRDKVNIQQGTPNRREARTGNDSVLLKHRPYTYEHKNQYCCSLSTHQDLRIPPLDAKT
jgi:hypothetical protein